MVKKPDEIFFSMVICLLYVVDAKNTLVGKTDPHGELGMMNMIGMIMTTMAVVSMIIM